MRVLFAILLATAVAAGAAFWVFLNPGGLSEDPIVGRWAVVDDDADQFELLADGTFLFADTSTGSATWQRLEDGRILIEATEPDGATFTLMLQVDLLEGGGEALMTMDGETERIRRVE